LSDRIYASLSAKSSHLDSVPPHPSGHYAEEVNIQARHPVIPAEALVRQTRLQSALRLMEEKGPSREPAPLKDLREMAAGRSSPDLDLRIGAFLAEDLVVEAWELCRTLRREAEDKSATEALTVRLAPLAATAQRQRSARWQLDTRRVLIRLCYAKAGGALSFDEGDLHAIFLQAFRLEGLRLLLDLGKRPRPLLSVGLPLSSGVGGTAESMDAMLREEPMEDPASLMARLNLRLPEGLHIQQWLCLPEYASPVGDLATLAHWRWEVPQGQGRLVRDQISSFLAASHWPWDRGPSHPGGPVDLRDLIPEARWEGSTLSFSTRLGPSQAINPLKMLEAILGIESHHLGGLVRTAVDLKPDPRLGQAERFQPKLKNMYEDAVLLSGGSNIILIDEEDDDPIRLGHPGEGP
jgi:radical SAM-linked protein